MTGFNIVYYDVPAGPPFSSTNVGSYRTTSLDGEVDPTVSTIMSLVPQSTVSNSTAIQNDDSWTMLFDDPAPNPLA